MLGSSSKDQLHTDMACVHLLATFVLLVSVGTTSAQQVHRFTQKCLVGDTCGAEAAAACTSTATVCTGSCTCNNGWIGSADCSGEPICTAAGTQCGSHGTCNTGGANPLCDCADGYYGYRCQIAPVCTAAGNECGAWGKCSTCGTAPNIMYSCRCLKGYGGNRCEIAPICSKHADCGMHGTCDYGQNPYICVCRDGYGGMRCDTPPYCTVRGFECGIRGICAAGSPSKCTCNVAGNTHPTCNSAPKAVFATLSLTVMAAGYFLLQ